MYKNTRLSCIRFINDVKATLTGVSSVPISYLDLDANSDIQDWPTGDVIGLGGFGLVDDEGFHDLTFAVTIVTANDPNLMRMTDYVNTFYKKMAHQQKFDLYNGETAVVMGKIVFEKGTAASPVGRSEMRNVATLLAHAVVVYDPVQA